MRKRKRRTTAALLGLATVFLTTAALGPPTAGAQEIAPGDPCTMRAAAGEIPGVLTQDPRGGPAACLSASADVPDRVAAKPPAIKGFKAVPVRLNGITGVRYERVRPAARNRTLKQEPLYYSNTYLHVSNATWYCYQFNADAANYVMWVTIGHPIGVKELETYPVWYSRSTSQNVALGVRYFSRPGSYHRVDYECRVLGVDTSFTIWSARQAGPVTPNT